MFHIGGKAELTRKHVSDMFLRGELEKEIRDPAKPHRLEGMVFCSDSDAECYMKQVEQERAYELYVHNQAPQCTGRGIEYTNIYIIQVKRNGKLLHQIHRLWQMLVH